MRKHFPKISSFILILVFAFIVTGFFVEDANAQACWRLGAPNGITNQATCEGAGGGGTWQAPGAPVPRPPNGPPLTGPAPTPGTVVTDPCASVGTGTVGNPEYDACKKTQAEIAAKRPAAKTGNWWDILSPLTWIAGALGWVAVAVLKIASYLTYLSGVLLNFIVQYTVVDMKEHLNESKSINDAWKTIRDVANMGFIFVLLYAAIRTILGIGSDTQKLVVNVIVVAILINFSLFFTKVVIDASNVLAITFYDSIAPGALSSNASIGISNSLMKPLGVQSIWKVAEGFDGEQLLIVGVMGTVISLIAAFVFFAVSIMFIVRFVVLIFVLILSPVAFVSFILPGLNGQWKKWLDALIGQAFFAPIYFLLTWIVIVVANGMPTNEPNWVKVFVGTPVEGGVSQVLPPATSDLGIIVNFVIVIALLIASLLIAKDWANKAGPGVANLTKWATGAAIGTAGFAGRQTIGRGLAAVAGNENLKERAEAGSRSARLALWAGRKGGGASFDTRGIGLGIGGAMGAGKAGGKGGFIEFKKDKAEDAAKRAVALGPSLEAIDQATQAVKRAKTAPERIVAQARLDKLKGVDDVRAKEILKSEGFTGTKEETKERIEELKKANKGAAQRRKDAYAAVMEKSILARAMGYNTAAAAQIRVGKTKKERFSDLAKEITKDDQGPEEESSATPAPTSPPPTGGTPLTP